MANIVKFFKDLRDDESAQGMLEYVLLAVAIVTIVALFKNKLRGWFDSSAAKIEGDVGAINGN
jgi:Flp pilus assembly pilin Flp